MKKSTVIILMFILTSITYTLIGDVELISIIYLSSIAIAISYGVLRGEINLKHISFLFLVIYIIEYSSTEIITQNMELAGSSKFTIAVAHYTFQIIASTLATIAFIFRVQISRLISKSGKISLTLFDGVAPWIYIYMTILLSLSLAEYVLYEKFNFTYLSFIYDYFKVLMFIAMSGVTSILLSMVFCHEKDLKRQSTNVE